MISNRSKRANLKELLIFDYFEVDKSLPKYSNENKENTYIGFGHNQSDESWDVTPNPSEFSVEIAPNGSLFYNGTLKGKIIHWLINKLTKNSAKVKISIKDFFTSVSKSYKELTPIGEIAEYYENALIQASGMGQKALVEKLKDQIDIIKGEAVLIAMGLKKYVTEKNIIDFYEKVDKDKNLKLTWIKNFNRIIPEVVYEMKKDIDQRMIFDNYVILHYDPEGEAEALTKEEIVHKKDPILFGLIKESRKLYYIADWKDEYCDLTLEEMFSTLKGKVLQINNNSVKKYIDKI